MKARRDKKGRFIKGARTPWGFKKGNKINACRVFSEEHRRKLSDRHKGMKHSLETKKKIGLWHLGEKNFHWKGGRVKTAAGYILIKCRNHPFADANGYVFEHRLVMERHIGRPLLPTEIVHHINGIKDNNRVENLMLFSSAGTHTNYHRFRWGI